MNDIIIPKKWEGCFTQPNGINNCIFGAVNNVYSDGGGIQIISIPFDELLSLEFLDINYWQNLEDTGGEDEDMNTEGDQFAIAKIKCNTTEGEQTYYLHDFVVYGDTMEWANKMGKTIKFI